MRPQPDFLHEFAHGNSDRTLLLLHGTGGNERDLISLGRELDPNASLLSPRGKILENGMPRFFRRLAEGVFDLEDLKTRTNELADFVAAAVRHYHAMLPLIPDKLPELSRVRVWIGAGDQDPIIPASETQRLVDLLRRAGADVTIRFLNGGHGLTNSEIDMASQWLKDLNPPAARR
jgi:phospholipase/carboxylesterase